jgi:hypothetical protein
LGGKRTFYFGLTLSDRRRTVEAARRVVYKFDDHALVKSATTVIVLDD